MLKIENTEVMGWEHTIRGMRNPKNSWEKSDSGYCDTIGDKFGDVIKPENYRLGPNDFDLMSRLRNAGTDHRKFMRMITVYLDITAPLYWWKEFDTYKVGTVANSTSTMHKIHSKPFEMSDFSTDHMTDATLEMMQKNIDFLEEIRTQFVETKDKALWYSMIQLLPESYNQMRTCTLNYENLVGIYYSRKGHKLAEWHTFCDWVKELPYFEELFIDNE